MRSEAEEWYKSYAAQGHKSSIASSPISTPKSKFVILGEEYECNYYSYNDTNVATIIATLNVLGEPYWIEFKKQGLQLDSEMCDFIESRLKVIKRNDKVEDILNNNKHS